MEKQLPGLVDFFFIQSLFGWIARLQKLISRSKSFIHDSSLSRKVQREAVTLTHSCSSSSKSRSNEDFDEHEVIELVMGRLGLVCEQESDDKRLTFDNVSMLFDEIEPCLAEVNAAFCVFDQNNDGFIDENEMGRVMGALGLKEGLGLESCREMIRNYDLNGDGLIDFSEFVKVVEKSFC